MMSEKFRGIFLRYKTAPVAIREKVAVTEDELHIFLDNIKQYTKATEALVLSTCNRTEIYYTATEDISKELIAWLFLSKGKQVDHEALQYFEIVDDSHAVTRHLFEVAIGLDAQILGDLQIINQVKKAYQATADKQLAGPYLHRLLHTIFFANKKVHQETSFRDGAASVSYAAAELVAEHATNFHEPGILVVGLGEIGADTVRNMVGLGLSNITIANRTASKAEALHDELPEHTRVVPLEAVAELLPQMSIIVSGIGSGEYFFTKSHFEKIPGLYMKLLVDLGMPRSIDPELEHIPGILLYNLDAIQAKVDGTLANRKASIPAVKAIIEEALAEFEDWSKEMIVSPTINKLKNALEQIRQEELTRYLKHLDAQQLEILDKATKNIIQKVLKLPVLQLKAACKRGEAETLIDVLNDLFNLEKVEANH